MLEMKIKIEADAAVLKQKSSIKCAQFFTSCFV